MDRNDLFAYEIETKNSAFDEGGGIATYIGLRANGDTAALNAIVGQIQDGGEYAVVDEREIDDIELDDSWLPFFDRPDVKAMMMAGGVVCVSPYSVPFEDWDPVMIDVEGNEIEISPTYAAPEPKRAKRGRPKGSKNKVKKVKE